MNITCPYCQHESFSHETGEFINTDDNHGTSLELIECQCERCKSYFYIL